MVSYSIFLSAFAVSHIFLCAVVEGSSRIVPVVEVLRGGNGEQRRSPSRHSDDDDDDDHRRTRSTKPLWSCVATESAKFSGKALSATARASGKAAYSLVSPKHVEWGELVGLWRLDQWMNEEDRMVQSNMELTRDKMVVIREPSSSSTSSKTSTMINRPCRFVAAQWPFSARVEFEVRLSDYDSLLLYTCTVHRKLADKTVLKLRGKIYEKRWGRKILVGTFVGRRRMKLLLDDEEEEEEDTDIEDDCSGEEDDDDQSGDEMGNRDRENTEEDESAT